MAQDQFVTDITDLDLDNINTEEGVDWGAEYQDHAARKVIPQPGRYDLRLPNTFGYGRGREGQLIISVDPLLFIDEPFATQGTKIMFTKVSTKRFKNANGSQAADLLRNVGSSATPRTPSEWAAAFEEIAGSVAENVEVIYRGYDKPTKTEYRQEQFPVNPETGKIMPVIEIPDEEAEGGKRLVWANLTVNVRGFAPPRPTK